MPSIDMQIPIPKRRSRSRPYATIAQNFQHPLACFEPLLLGVAVDDALNLGLISLKSEDHQQEVLGLSFMITAYLLVYFQESRF
jgi:hypothetical protein